MATLRTALEAALGYRVGLDMEDLDLGDYETQDAADVRREVARQEAALAMGEHLYYEAALAGEEVDPR